MKKFMIFIFLLTLVLPIVVRADNCSVQQLNEYKKVIENITVDINYNKNAQLEYGDIPENVKPSRIKGTFMVKFNNIPENYYVIFTNGIETFRFDNDMDETGGIVGDIYKLTFKNKMCEDSILKKYSLYIPSYNYVNKNSVWNDKTVYINPTNENKPLNKTFILILILLTVLVLLAFLTTKVIRNKRAGDIK